MIKATFGQLMDATLPALPGEAPPLAKTRAMKSPDWSTASARFDLFAWIDEQLAKLNELNKRLWEDCSETVEGKKVLKVGTPGQARYLEEFAKLREVEVSNEKLSGIPAEQMQALANPSAHDVAALRFLVVSET